MPSQTLGTLLINVEANTQQLIKGFDRAENAVKKTTETMTNSVKLLTSAFIGLAAVDLGRSLSRQADTMTNINSKLKLVTKSTQELTKAQAELFKIAQQTRTGFADNVDLFQRVAMSTNELGLSQKEILRLTETINKSLTISGTTAEGASALIMQLGQAFSSNFQAVSQELNTLKDQAPSLYQALLKGTGKTSAEFKKMAEDGELSSQLIIDAISNQEKAIDADFGKMAKTISQSYVQIGNSTTLLIGNIDKLTNVSTSVSKTFTEISKSIDGITNEDIERFAQLAKIVGSVGLSYFAITKALKSYNAITTISVEKTKLLEKAVKAESKAYNLAVQSVKKNSKQLLVQSKKQALYAKSLRSTASATNATTKATRTLITTFKAFAPLAIAGGIVAIADALFTASKNAETLEDTLKGTGEELKKLTINQLEYRKALLQSELATERLALANAKADASSQGFFESDIEHKKDLAFRDEQIKRFETLTKKIRDINSLLDTANTIVLEPIEVAEKKKKKKEVEDTEKKDILTTSLSDWENYYRTIGDMSTAWAIKESQLRLDYVDLTDTQFKKVAEIAKLEYFDKLKELEDFKFKIDIDTSGFDGVSKSIMTLSNSFEDLGDEQKAFNKFTSDYNKIKDPQEKDRIKFNKAEQKHLQNQTKGYMSVAGAIGGMFEKGSKEASAFQAIQAGIAITEGVTAILSAGKGDPYTAPARMAAMAGAVASLLSSAKIAFGYGGTKTTTTSDAFSAQVENTGTGSTLGDSAQASESITSSLEVLEDFAQPQFRVLNEMNKSLLTISEKIGGLSSLLIQQGGFAFGEGFNQAPSSQKGLGVSYDKLYEDTVKALSFGNEWAELGIRLLTIGAGKITGKIIGGIFGKTSVNQQLTDYGINFNKVLLTSAINQIDGQAFQTIATTITKKSWFKKSSSTTIRTFFQSLNDETERQFSLVLNDLYNTTIKAGVALDRSSLDLDKSLSGFIVNIGKISTKGKTGAEIQEQISNVFSKIGDDIASTAFPELTEFQKVGEGMFSTLTRVATGMQEAEFYIKRLGGTFEDIKFTDIENKQGNVGFQALSQSIIKADEALFGFDNGVIKIIESLNGTTEELFTTYNILEDVRVNLELTGQSAKNLSSAMITGAGSINNLSDATKDYFENFLTDAEQLASKTQQLNKEFLKLNQTMPTSVKGFKDLIGNIDTSTDAGAELYGRLISLSKGFSDVFGTAQGNIDILTKLRSTFLSLSNTVGKTISSLIGNTDKAQLQTNQIESFWKKRNEADALIAKNATLTSSEQTRLNSLIGEINTLAGTIQGGSTGNSSIITNELIGTLSTLENNLNLKDEILKVNIVGINDNVNLLTGTEQNVPNISNIINPSTPLNDSKDTLNAILDKISIMKDDLSDMLDNSNALINGFAIPKVEVVP